MKGSFLIKRQKSRWECSAVSVFGHAKETSLPRGQDVSDPLFEVFASLRLPDCRVISGGSNRLDAIALLEAEQGTCQMQKGFIGLGLFFPANQ
jgi:hypothetical protein